MILLFFSNIHVCSIKCAKKVCRIRSKWNIVHSDACHQWVRERDREWVSMLHVWFWKSELIALYGLRNLHNLNKRSSFAWKWLQVCINHRLYAMPVAMRKYSWKQCVTWMKGSIIQWMSWVVMNFAMRSFFLPFLGRMNKLLFSYKVDIQYTRICDSSDIEKQTLIQCKLQMRVWFVRAFDIYIF